MLRLGVDACTVLGLAPSVIAREKRIEAWIGKPLQSAQPGTVWPYGIERGNLLLEASGPSGITRVPSIPACIT